MIFRSRLVLSGLVTSAKMGNVGVITLNSPKNLNALTQALGREFTAAVDTYSNDPTVKAVIVTGAGNAFSAGGDLDFLEARCRSEPEANYKVMIEFYNLFLCINRLKVPVIAAINGMAVGAGMCMSLGCDYRIALASTKFGFTFARLGLHPGMGVTHFLPQLVGFQQASRLLLTGAMITAAEGLKIGLVGELVESNEGTESNCAAVLARAVRFAGEITSGGPLAVSSTLSVLRDKKWRGLEDALSSEATHQGVCYKSGEVLEGIQAIREKRAPVFQ